jgi:hypothetical protein
VFPLVLTHFTHLNNLVAVDGSVDSLVAKVSAVAAVSTTVDLISATGVSNISGIPAILGVPAVGGIPLCLPSLFFMLFPPVLAPLLLTSPDFPFVSCTALLLSAFLEFLLWPSYC